MDAARCGSHTSEAEPKPACAGAVEKITWMKVNWRCRFNHMAQDYCPKCLLGKRIKRKGKYREFIGCSRYPYCDYIERISQDDKDDLEKQADEILRQNGKAELII